MNTNPKAAKILVVDDDADLLLLMETRLRSNGYEVVTAKDGEAAIEISRREHPALILLDLGLPRLDGFAVCRTLKSDPSTCEIPIIVVSAKSQKVDKARASQFGAEGYLAKPFEPQVLLNEIRNLRERSTPHVT